MLIRPKTAAIPILPNAPRKLFCTGQTRGCATFDEVNRAAASGESRRVCRGRAAIANERFHMKNIANNTPGKNDYRAGCQAASRLGVVMLLAAGVLLAGGGYWFSQRAKQPSAEVISDTPPSFVLSESTRKILANLTTPIEVWFYVPAEAVALPENLRGYITRVGNLLAEYERGAEGKFRVSRTDPQTDAAAKKAASVAGVVPFASETGEIVYLGLTVGNGARIESITPLAPEWEAALESDISRAIQRVTKTATGAAGAARGEVQPAPIDPMVSEQLLRLFPNLKTRSYDDMAQELRVAALEEFKAATTELQTKVSAAQQTLAEAQANKSEAEQQQALKNFQQVQAEQAEKLKGITAWLQERLTALQQLKSARELSAPSH